MATEQALLNFQTAHPSPAATPSTTAFSSM